MDRDFYSFARLTDLQSPLTVRISSLQGKLPRASRTELLDRPEERLRGRNASAWPDLVVKTQLFADNKPLSLAYLTPYKASKAGYQLSEVITIPQPLSQLPLSSQLCFTVYECFASGAESVVGGTTMRLFSKKGSLKKASHRLYLWPGVEADGAVDSATPSKVAEARRTEERRADEMGRLEKLIKLHESSTLPRLSWLDKLAYRRIEAINAVESAASDDVFLYVDLPRWEVPVVYSETGEQSSDVRGVAEYTAPGLLDGSLFTIFDADADANENPVEAKSRRLARSHRTGPLDRELKPNAGVRDEINDILAYPPTRPLSAREADLIWSFRFYLSRFPSGLTKFLKSVSWSDASEAKQATEVLMPMWAEVGVDDAMELLGPGAAFRHAKVRAHAVERLAKAEDEELVLYLLQLVQALKFGAQTPRRGQEDGTPSEDGLKTFLFDRATRSETPMLASNLFWFLTVEKEDRVWGKHFGAILDEFQLRLRDVDAERHGMFKRQAALVARLAELARTLRTSKDARPKKIEKLRAAITSGLATFEDPVELPLDTRIVLTGLSADKSTIFKSNLFPMLLHFDTAGGASYPVIFKNGDDLRQDQLVIQLFTLMDRLLRNENLDLRITPYRVLATAQADGMVQFVESMTVAAILTQHGSLVAYLRQHAPDASSPTYGISPPVFDNFVRSCAGYSVVTYLLGVGDRHLDNLLLSPSGHFFHVDFGYILGRDPKPFPPPVKICKEMVDAMGGAQSVHSATFRRLAGTGFMSLRSKANLILNLIALMTDANVPDIKLEPDKAVLKVQEKFLLNVGDEEALHYFEELLSENNLLANVFDRIHGAAQFFRS